MLDGKAGGGEVIKSEDPGETLEEAGIAGDDTTEDTDGATDKADAEIGKDESDEAGDADPDSGAEGEETDRDREADAKEGNPTELEAIKELLKQRDAELAKIKESAEKPQDERGPDAEPITDEKWAVLEERFGGLSRNQIQPLAELVHRQVSGVQSAMAERFAKIEKELSINAMAEQDGTRDIRSFRKEIDEFMGNFHPRDHADPKLLRMALAYARGVKSTDAAKKSAASKERGLRVVGAGKPNTGGASAGGKTSGVKLTNQERQVARLGGMSDREYAELKYGSRKR